MAELHLKLKKKKDINNHGSPQLPFIICEFSIFFMGKNNAVAFTVIVESKIRDIMPENVHALHVYGVAEQLEEGGIGGLCLRICKSLPLNQTAASSWFMK